MGLSLNAVGSFNLPTLGGDVAGGQTQARVSFDHAPQQAPGGDSASLANAAPENQAGSDAGVVYQVPDAVALQLQLQNALGANSPASGAASGAAATTSQTAFSTAAAAAQVSTANAAASSGTSSVQGEENQLLATLQSLGLSPSAIQEFMNIGDLLAEISPGLFQAFVNAMANLAQPAQGVSSSGSVSPAAATAAASTSNTTPAPEYQVEVTSAQISAAEVQVTPTSPGQGSAVSASHAAVA